MIKKILCLCSLFVVFTIQAQEVFTKKDSLFGSNSEYRKHWNVLKYSLTIEPDFKNKYLKGKNIIFAEVVDSELNKIPIQIDLKEPMKITSITLGNQNIKYRKDDNFYFLELNKQLINQNQFELEVEFEGNPIVANNPPWDGGWVFTKDDKGNPWMSVACQGEGASIWYPLKDIQSDEPELGCELNIIVDKNLVGVGNGKLLEVQKKGNKKIYSWKVENPINSYNIIPYIGKYVNFSETYKGEQGNLNLNYWVLESNLEKAKEHFKVVPSMLSSFEYWFGAYPFYKDDYKLVESPYLGMEHQSNIAYGNRYMNGYLGYDISDSGYGLDWDYIIIHESGHEWFGNSITTEDVADMWIQEGFTTYSEVLFVESTKGKEQANEYCRGLRRGIKNEKPIIGKYNVRNEGSSDMYSKGANIIHTIRQLYNDDAKFRKLLRDLNELYYHKIVTSKEIEDYISNDLKFDLTPFFNQYLRNTEIPYLEIKKEKDGEIYYRYANCIESFNLPLKIKDSQTWIYPTTQWKKSEIGQAFSIDSNFYIRTREIR
ncbi:MAG: M1 family metallopeptidase [Flavobacteriales bacterium]|nr:M1 family metallopeptidase [Flavobacteriales bacterium]